jgi:hypothetical protein
MDNNDEQLLWDEKYKLLKEWLEQGGVKGIRDRILVHDLLAVRSMPNSPNQLDPSSLTSRVRALMNLILAGQNSPPRLNPEQLSNYESFVQKGLYFEQLIIDTEDALEQMIQEVMGKENHLFRGINEANFMLYSSLQRDWIWGKRQIAGVDYRHFLERLLANARQYDDGALAKYINDGGDDANNDVSVLSILQHYGCATPLLDWTYNGLVGLYFAASDVRPAPVERAREVEQYISLYHIEEEYFAQSGIRQVASEGVEEFLPDIRPAVEQKIAELKEIFKDIPEADFLFEPQMIEGFLADDQRIKRVALGSYHEAGLTNHLSRIEALMLTPVTYFSDRGEDLMPLGLQNSPNVKNQGGVFTWNREPIYPIEHTVREMVLADKSDANHVYTRCWNINKDLVPYLQRRLTELGVTEEYIFPEKDQDYLRNLAKLIFEATAKEFENQAPNITNQ